MNEFDVKFLLSLYFDLAHGHDQIAKLFLGEARENYIVPHDEELSIPQIAEEINNSLVNVKNFVELLLKRIGVDELYFE